MSTISNDTIEYVWTQTVRYVAHKIYGLDLPKAVEDIAAEAIEYALKNKKATWDDTPASEKHLAAAAKKVAQWNISKAIQKTKRAIASYTLDPLEEGKDGEPLEISRAEAKYLMELYHDERVHKERMEMGSTALAKLDSFLAGKGVPSRDIGVYKDRDLYGMPTDAVCKKYSITACNLYKIVCVVKGILATKGRALIRE